MWVPLHVGVVGNRDADARASKGARQALHNVLHSKQVTDISEEWGLVELPDTWDTDSNQVGGSCFTSVSDEGFFMPGPNNPVYANKASGGHSGGNPSWPKKHPIAIWRPQGSIRFRTLWAMTYAYETYETLGSYGSIVSVLHFPPFPPRPPPPPPPLAAPPTLTGGFDGGAESTPDSSSVDFSPLAATWHCAVNGGIVPVCHSWAGGGSALWQGGVAACLRKCPCPVSSRSGFVPPVGTEICVLCTCMHAWCGSLCPRNLNGIVAVENYYYVSY